MRSYYGNSQLLGRRIAAASTATLTLTEIVTGQDNSTIQEYMNNVDKIGYIVAAVGAVALTALTGRIIYNCFRKKNGD